MKESEIQARIKEELESRDWIVLRLVNVGSNGYPDLLCLKCSTAIFIEVKRPGKEARKLQKYRHKQLREAGFAVFVMDDAKNVPLIFTETKK